MPRAKPSTSSSPSAGSAAAYDRFLPDARKLRPVEVTPLRMDLHLALANASVGVTSVFGQQARVKAELPKLPLTDLTSLPDLGLAVAFAAAEVERYAPAPRTVKKKLARAGDLRRLLLQSAEALALAGLLPAGAVRKIRAGKGYIDAAGDCVALAALFRKNAAQVKGKSPVTAALITEADQLGSELLSVLRPGRAKAPGAARDLKAAREARDRLWTLFVRRWDELWRAGAWLFGHEVDEKVPALGARAGHKRKKS